MASRKADETAASAIEQELGQLTDADLLRLERYARYQVFRYPSIDPKEVLDEAVARLLGGSRNWPPEVPFRAFFCNVIRSVADEFRERAREHHAAANEAGEAAPDGNPAQHAEDRAFLKAIWELFDGHEAVRALLSGVELGLSAKEVKRRYALSDSEYDAARKRLERTLAKKYPNGMKS